MSELKCEVCNFTSSNLEEVCYYDINGNIHCTEYDIENNAQNPDALVHTLCNECVDNFKFL